jgi:hypothetical protein
MPSYYWSTSACYCSYASFINVISGECSPCSSLPSATYSTCTSCKSPSFVSGNFGCISCSTLANNGGSTSCCATGFTFSSVLAICKCDSSKGYSINANGVCSKCATTDSNCIHCLNNYVYNGHYCLHGSLLSNYDYTTAYSCKQGFAFKKDPYTNKVLSCVCSFNSAYYLSGAQCTACAATLPGSVSLANCQNCATSAGFFKGFSECIYCPAAANAVGTATINGCDCQPNYFWNTNTAACECDFTLGFIGGAISSCISCAAIANTAITVSPLGCSCLRGYVLNSATNTCNCDTTSSSVFVKTGICIDCSALQGATGAVGTDGVSCVCISSYYWNPGKNSC